MALHEIHLQLRQLVLAYRDVAQRAEAGGDTIDGFFLIGYLLIEIAAAANDALAGIVAQCQLIVLSDNFSDALYRQMFSANFVYHDLIISFFV